MTVDFTARNLFLFEADAKQALGEIDKLKRARTAAAKKALEDYEAESKGGKSLAQTLSVLTSAIGGQATVFGKAAEGGKRLAEGFGLIGLGVMGAGYAFQALTPLIGGVISDLADLGTFGTLEKWKPLQDRIDETTARFELAKSAVAEWKAELGLLEPVEGSEQKRQRALDDLIERQATLREAQAALDRAEQYGGHNKVELQLELNAARRAENAAVMILVKAEQDLNKVKVDQAKADQARADADRKYSEQKSAELERMIAEHWKLYEAAAAYDRLLGMGPGKRAGNIALGAMIGMPEAQIASYRENYQQGQGFGDKGLMATIEAAMGKDKGRTTDELGLGLGGGPGELQPTLIEKLFGPPEKIDAVSASFGVLSSGVNAMFDALSGGEGAAKAWEQFQRTIAQSLSKLMFRFARAETAHAAASFAIQDYRGVALHGIAAGLFAGAGAFAGNFGGSGGGGGGGGYGQYGSGAGSTVQSTQSSRPTIIVLGHGFSDDKYIEAARIRKGLDYAEKMGSSDPSTVRFE